MNSILFVSQKWTHNFNTGINRYENELFKEVSDSEAFLVKRFLKEKPTKSARVFNYFFGYLKTTSAIFKKYKIIHVASPMFIGKIDAKNKLVTTIHDLCPLITPQAYPTYQPFVFRKNIKNLIDMGSYFIVNSECTKRDLLKFFKIDSARVFITPLGVSDNFCIQDVAEIVQVKEVYGLPDSYFLFTGAMNKRKNLTSVIQAYIQFKKRDKTHTKLVLAGRMNWGGSLVQDQVEKEGLEEDIVLPGYIEDKHMPALIAGAQASLYMSLYEGFGFPALEAMKVGTPVIASNVSSIPEVVGNAGVLLDPLDIKGIAEAMDRLVSDVNYRNDLVIKGKEQAKKFTWKQTSQKTLAVYQQLLKNH